MIHFLENRRVFEEMNNRLLNSFELFNNLLEIGFWRKNYKSF